MLQLKEITDIDDLEERRGIIINEDDNEEIYDGAITYPPGYFIDGDGDDDDEDNEKLNLGDYVDNSSLGIEEF